VKAEEKHSFQGGFCGPEWTHFYQIIQCQGCRNLAARLYQYSSEGYEETFMDDNGEETSTLLPDIDKIFTVSHILGKQILKSIELESVPLLPAVPSPESTASSETGTASSADSKQVPTTQVKLENSPAATQPQGKLVHSAVSLQGFKELLGETWQHLPEVIQETLVEILKAVEGLSYRLAVAGIRALLERARADKEFHRIRIPQQVYEAMITTKEWGDQCLHKLALPDPDEVTKMLAVLRQVLNIVYLPAPHIQPPKQKNILMYKDVLKGGKGKEKVDEK